MRKLDYHQAALDLLQLQPDFSTKAVDRLDMLEKEFDLIVPPAVKEWYGLKNAYRTLKKYSNGDAPTKLENMVHDFDDFYAESYMTIMVENQGVWRWALNFSARTTWCQRRKPQCPCLNSRNFIMSASTLKSRWTTRLFMCG